MFFGNYGFRKTSLNKSPKSLLPEDHAGSNM